MRRIFVNKNDFVEGGLQITNKNVISYLSVVLRMDVGDELLVSDGVARTCETKITEISKSLIELNIQNECPFEEGYGTQITLYQGMPKGSKMDEIVRKSTELGVCRIVPTLTERSVPEIKRDAFSSKVSRWRRIAEEAARQSHRMSIPEVSEVISFADAVKELSSLDYDVTLALYELEEKQTLKVALQENKIQSPKIAVFIGPEGGFEQEEISQLVSAGAAVVTVGETILRTETAGPAAIAMILYENEM